MSSPSPRYAIYFAPQPDSELARFGARCLGRDAQTGSAVPQFALDGIAAADFASVTAEPRRYGFHGTLKAPFRLTDGATEGDLLRRLQSFAATRSAFAEAPLMLAEIAGFLALVPSGNTPLLHDLAACCVRAFDDLRAPPTPAEQARRLAAGLTPAQEALLARWGYPYVMEEFRFHLTLTGSLPAEQRMRVKRALTRPVAPFVEAPLTIDAVTLFVQPAPDRPFTVLARYPFGATAR